MSTYDAEWGMGSVEESTDPASAELREERDRYLDLAQRTKAEFDNYRRRIEREQPLRDARARAHSLEALLPVVDDLERAVQAADQGDLESLRVGVVMIHRALVGAFSGQGVEVVDPLGEPFDPHSHEALGTEPHDAPEGTVVRVLQKGYRIDGQLVRPARVVLAGS